jgi:mannose-6-phosphate isomerase-like protein (cupin superfamily)
VFSERLAGGLISAPDAALVLAEWIDPGGGTDPPTYIAPLHIHHEDDEAWYVLEGRLGFDVGGEQRDVGAGEAIMVPRGTPHSYWNAQAAPTRYLLVMTPRIRALIDALHAGDRDDYAAVFEEHASQLLT